MNVFKLEVMIINHDELTADEIMFELENTKYANRCISPHVMEIDSVEIGEWADENLLNFFTTQKEEFKRLFSEKETNE